MDADSADHELTFVSLSGPAEALHRATESGSGMLATGRPWVRQEGWLLKESSGLGGGWQLRYFVVAGDRLEYFKEEVTKLSLRPGERLGVDGDQMDKLWANAKKSDNLVKFGGGFYAGKIPAPMPSPKKKKGLITRTSGDMSVFSSGESVLDAVFGPEGGKML